MSLQIEVINNGETGLVVRDKMNNNFENISNYISLDTIKIFTVDDFPVAVGGIIQLENKNYVISAPIVLTSTLRIPETGSVRIISSIVENSITYTGGNDLLDADNSKTTCATLLLNNVILLGSDVGSGKGTLFNIAPILQNGDIFILNLTSIIQGFESLGLVKNISFYQHHILIQECETGLELQSPPQISITTTTVFSGTNQATTFFRITGSDIILIAILLVDGVLESNEKLFYFDPTIIGTDIRVYNSSVTINGNFLEDGSLDHRCQNCAFIGNIKVQNSTAKAKLSITDNVETTVISAVNTPTIINALWSDGVEEERFAFQDECTFDNTTNEIITTFDHGLSNGDVIHFHPITGTLPVGILADVNYYVINTATNDFQISDIEGGVVIEFIDDGSGTNYLHHTTGNNDLGWLIYDGTETITADVNGWVSMIGTVVQNTSFRIKIIKTLADGSEIAAANGGVARIDTTIEATTSIVDILELNNGEGVKFLVENLDDANNVIITNSIITIKKV